MKRAKDAADEYGVAGMAFGILVVILIGAALFQGAVLWLAWRLVAEGAFHAPHLSFGAACVAMLAVDLIGAAFKSTKS